MDFVCHLVSANGNLIEPCIRVLVARLLPSEGDHVHAGRYRLLPADRADVCSDPEVQIPDGLDECVHDALEQLLRIFPASSSCLVAVLRENFPHKRHSSHVHVTFLRNMLRILDDSPGLYEQLLTCVVEKCVQLDVSFRPSPAALDRMNLHHMLVLVARVQVDIKLDDYGVGEDEDEGDEDDSEEEDDGGLPFKMDEDGDSDEKAAAKSSSPTPGNSTGGMDMADSTAIPTTPCAAAQQQQLHRTDSTAEKLDLMMDMLFDFIKRQCRNRQDEAGQRQADDLFRAMMRVFNSTILTT